MSIDDGHDARMKDLKNRLANVEIKCKSVDEDISRYQSDTVKYKAEAQEHMKEFGGLYPRLGAAADKQKEFIEHMKNTRPGDKHVINQLESSFKLMQSAHHKTT